MQSEKAQNDSQDQEHDLQQQNQQHELYQEEVVVFKFKRQFQQESFDQIKIHSKKVKPNPQNAEKACKNYQKTNFVDKETMLANLFQKLQLSSKQQPQQQESNNQKPQSTESPFRSQSSTTNKQFFLKKVQFLESPSENTIQASQLNQIQTQMKIIKSHARKQDLQQKFNKFRNITSSSTQNKRIKYKIIDIKQSNFVNFGGQNYEYQDLSKEYSPNERANVKYDYYVLKKGQIDSKAHQNVPQIVLPQQAEYLLEDQADTQMKAESLEDSESDSNCQDRSDYEYPQEDYKEEDSDNESEKIISGDRQKSDYNSDSEDLNNSYQEEDEEEYYRQYLKRCKRQEQGDAEITYLYNFKSKYQDDSDD